MCRLKRFLIHWTTIVELFRICCHRGYASVFRWNFSFLQKDVFIYFKPNQYLYLKVSLSFVWFIIVLQMTYVNIHITALFRLCLDLELFGCCQILKQWQVSKKKKKRSLIVWSSCYQLPMPLIFFVLIKKIVTL